MPLFCIEQFKNYYCYLYTYHIQIKMTQLSHFYLDVIGVLNNTPAKAGGLNLVMEN